MSIVERKRKVRHPGVRVNHTQIGRGVFARHAFEPEQEISQVSGEVIDVPDHGSDYAIDLGDGLALEPAAPFRYLNHSCQPNCELAVWDVEEQESPHQREVWLHSLLRIEPGEQLTIDYAWPAASAIPCDCRSSACRGWVVSEEDLAQVLEEAAAQAG
jgi:hypothetical protein